MPNNSARDKPQSQKDSKDKSQLRDKKVGNKDLRQEIGFATPEEMQGYIIELSKQIKNKEFDTLSMSQETAKAFNEETLRSLEQMRKMEEQID